MTTDFSQLGIEQPLLDRLSAINITEPTAVQKKVIPLIAEGSHLLFQSETGTGKTFAYLLPLIQRLQVITLAVRTVQVQFLVYWVCLRDLPVITMCLWAGMKVPTIPSS